MGTDGIPGLFPNADGTQIIGLKSPTLPPTSVVGSDGGSRQDPPGGNGPPDGDGPDDGDDKGKLEQRGNGGKKHPSGSRRPPGGGPGDGDDDGDGDDNGDDDQDDEDRNFIRRMRALFGAPMDRDSEKNKVKEADTIKVPAFPHAESYRNWRIRTIGKQSCRHPQILTKRLTGSQRHWQKARLLTLSEMWVGSQLSMSSCCQH